MKRYVLALLLFAPSLSAAPLTEVPYQPAALRHKLLTMLLPTEIRPIPSGPQAGASLSGSGTANLVAKWSSASALTNSSITDTGSAVTVANNVTITGTADEFQLDVREVAGQTTFNTLFRNSDGSLTTFYVGPASLPTNGTLFYTRVQGTFPTTPTGALIGSEFDVTSAGNQAFTQSVLRGQLKAGYTGSSSTFVLTSSNVAAGTGLDFNLDDSAGFSIGNHGLFSITNSTTTGLNIGIEGMARGGDRNIGGLFKTTFGKNGAYNIGVMGVARNGGTTPTEIGGLFAISNTATADPLTLGTTTAALIADNTDSTADIVQWRDNSSAVMRVIDSGASWWRVGAKDLTSATPTAFVRVAVPSNGRQGGIVEYCVDANDGTNYQTRCGSVSFSLVNEGGTEAGAVGTPADADGTPTGTLTAAFTVASNAADTLDILCNADSSLAETTLRINYTVRLFGNAATAVTPQ